MITTIWSPLPLFVRAFIVPVRLFIGCFGPIRMQNRFTFLVTYFRKKLSHFYRGILLEAIRRTNAFITCVKVNNNRTTQIFPTLISKKRQGLCLCWFSSYAIITRELVILKLPTNCFYITFVEILNCFSCSGGGCGSRQACTVQASVLRTDFYKKSRFPRGLLIFSLELLGDAFLFSQIGST